MGAINVPLKEVDQLDLVTKPVPVPVISLSPMLLNGYLLLGPHKDKLLTDKTAELRILSHQARSTSLSLNIIQIMSHQSRISLKIVTLISIKWILLTTVVGRTKTTQ